MNRYPSQFTRMKRERWYYVKSQWQQQQVENKREHQMNDEVEDDWFEEQSNIFSQALNRVRAFYQKRTSPFEREADLVVKETSSEANLPPTLEALREHFLEEIFQSQLRWASSSLVDVSTLHPRYQYDEWLRFFALRLPDNYFLMYKPVFFIKNAPIELEIMLISPTELSCITILEGQEHSVFEATSERFWIEYVDKTRKKRLSPFVSLGHMTGVVSQLMKDANLSFPIRKVVLAPMSVIDNKVQGAKVDFVDKRNFQAWHEKLQRHPSPLKKDQVLTAQALLKHCHIVASSREEADEESSGADRENPLN